MSFRTLIARFLLLAVPFVFALEAFSTGCGPVDRIEPIELDFNRTYTSTKFVGQKNFVDPSDGISVFYRTVSYSGSWGVPTYKYNNQCLGQYPDPPKPVDVQVGGDYSYRITDGWRDPNDLGEATQTGYTVHSSATTALVTGGVNPGGTFDNNGTTGNLLVNPLSMSSESPVQRIFGNPPTQVQCQYSPYEYLFSWKAGSGSSYAAAPSISGAIIVSLSEKDTLQDALKYAYKDNGPGNPHGPDRNGSVGTNGGNDAYYYIIEDGNENNQIRYASLEIEALFASCFQEGLEVHLLVQKHDLSSGDKSLLDRVFYEKADVLNRVKFEHTIEPEYNTRYVVLGVYAESKADCNRQYTMGYGSAAYLASVHWYGGIGTLHGEKIAGELTIDADQWGDLDFKTSDLKFISRDSSGELVKEVLDGNNALRQVQTLHDVVDISTVTQDVTYKAEIFNLDQCTYDSNTGLYTPAAGENPHITYLFEKTSDGQNPDKLRISDLLDGSTVRVKEYFVDTSGNWVLEEGNASEFGRRTVRSISSSTTVPTELDPLKEEAGLTYKAVLEKVYDGQGTLVKQVEKVYDVQSIGGGYSDWVGGNATNPTVGFNRLRIERIYKGSSTTVDHEIIYQYGFNSGDNNYRKLTLVEDTRGAWEEFEYDANKRISKWIRPYLDSASGAQESEHEVTEYVYDEVTDVNGDGIEDLTTQFTRKVKTKAVSRRFEVRLAGSQTLSSGIPVREERTVLGATPSATLADSSNLVHRQFYYADPTSEFFEEPYAYVQPDGMGYVIEQTRTAQNPASITYRVGKISDPDEPVAISSGSSTVLTYNNEEQLTSVEVTDIGSGHLINEIIYPEEDFDLLGRPQTVLYYDGTSETRTYSCCGLESVTGPDGVVTEFEYDSLGRLKDTTADGGATPGPNQIIERRILNPNGLLEALYRGSSEASLNLVEDYHYHLDGTLSHVQSRFLDNAADSAPINGRVNLNVVEEVVGGKIRTTTTLPNTSTRILERHRDGKLYEVRGTAEYGVRYAYATEMDSTLGYDVETVTQTRLLADDTTESTEFTKQYLDALGRVYKIERPSPTGSNAVTTFSYFGANEHGGKISSVTDPDLVVSLFDYDELERLSVRAVDMNGNGIIDFGGTDRIERNTQSFTIRMEEGSSFVVSRQTSEIWETDNDSGSTVVSQIDTSLNGALSLSGIVAGTTSWISDYGLETEITATYDSAAFKRTVLTRYPDDSTLRQTFVHGLLDEEKAQAADGTTVLSLKEYEYEGENWVDTITVANDRVTDYGYYGDGRIKSINGPDPDSLQTGTGFDRQLLQYSYTNNPTSISKAVTYPGGGTRVETYYSTGTLKEVSGTLAEPLAYTYDYAGRLESLTTWHDKALSTNPATTVWEYYSSGEFKQKWYNSAVATPQSGSAGVSFSYTAAGRPAGRVSARVAGGQTNPIATSYIYGTAHGSKADLRFVTYQNDPSGTPGIEYVYNRAGTVESIVDASGKRQFSYDKGVIVEVEFIDDLNGATADPFLGMKIQRPLDSLHRLDRIGIVNASSSIIYDADYGYDDASRLEEVLFGNQTAAYGYDPLGDDRETLTYNPSSGHSVVAVRTYDDLDRFKSQSFSVTGGANYEYAYLFNNLNQRTEKKISGDDYWVYGYDDYGRLNDSDKKLSSGTSIEGYQTGFEFDDIGNRKSESFSGEPVQTYSPDIFNQYDQKQVRRAIDIIGTAVPSATVFVDGDDLNPLNRAGQGEYFHEKLDFTGDPDAQVVQYTVTATDSGKYADADGEQFLKANPETFGYDADGNLEGDGLWDYSWDAENRLVTVETSTGGIAGGFTKLKVEFKYDYLGRRYLKEVYEDTGSGYALTDSTYFLYDGLNLIASFDSNLSLEESYVWGLDLSSSLHGSGGIGGLLFVALADTGAVYAPWYDGSGNIMGYVDLADGKVMAQFEYGPFGEPIRESGSLVDKFSVRSSTKATDLELGIVYYGYRYYQPETGRWLSRDPLGEAGGANLYAFNANSPTNLIDPDGQIWQYVGGAAIGAVAGGAIDIGVQLVQNGGDFGNIAWDSVATSAITGAVQGALAPGLGSVFSKNGTMSLGRFLKVAGAEALLGAGDQLVRNQLDPCANWNKGVGWAALTGAALGPLADWGGTTFGRWANKRIARYFGPQIDRLSHLNPFRRGAANKIPDGKFYSVAYEMKLNPTSYPKNTPYMHFKEANTSLNNAMKSNPTFAELGITVPKSPTGNIMGKAPADWVWHHDRAEGIMQLVPKSQHPNIPGGIFWETLHPDAGKGGMSIWGGGY